MVGPQLIVGDGPFGRMVHDYGSLRQGLSLRVGLPGYLVAHHPYTVYSRCVDAARARARDHVALDVHIVGRSATEHYGLAVVVSIRILVDGNGVGTLIIRDGIIGSRIHYRIFRDHGIGHARIDPNSPLDVGGLNIVRGNTHSLDQPVSTVSGPRNLDGK